MNRDAILVILLLVLIGGGVTAFMLWSGDATDTNLETDGEVVAEESNDDEVRRNVSRAATDVDDVNPNRPRIAPTDVTDAPTTPTADGAARIRGRVFSPEGDPVADASVALCVDESDMPNHSMQGAVRHLLTTDEQGTFEFEGFETRDRYVLRVDHQDFASKFLPRVEVQDGEQKQIQVRLERGLEVTGVVFDEEDNPLPDVEIMVVDQNNRAMDPTAGVERTAKSDGLGAFVVRNLNPGYKRVSAAREGYATRTDPAVRVVRGKPTKPLEFKLGPGSYIGGVVKDQNDNPVPDVIITAQPLNRTATGRGGRNLTIGNYPSIKSGPDGVFRYDGLTEGTYALNAHKRGFGSARRQTAKTGANAVQIRLIRKPIVRGRVVDLITGDPVAAFRITESRNEHLVFDTPRVTQRFTNDDGEFEFKAAHGGDFYLFARAAGYAAGRSVKLQAQDGAEIDGVVISVGPGATVSGVVVDSEGNGIANADTSLVPKSQVGGQPNPFSFLIENGMRKAQYRVRTDANGNYKFANVGEGYFTVRASRQGFSKSELDSAVFIGKTPEVTMPELTLPRGGRISGLVRNKEGQLAPNSTIQLASKGQLGASYTATSKSDGTYEIKNVKPGIYYIDVASVSGEDVNPFERLLRQQARREVVIGDGDDINMDLGP